MKFWKTLIVAIFGTLFICSVLSLGTENKLSIEFIAINYWGILLLANTNLDLSKETPELTDETRKLIKRRMKDIKNNNVVSTEEMKKRLGF